MNKFDSSSIKNYLVPLLVLIAIILIVPFVIIPQIRQLKDKNLQVKQTQERLDGLNKKLEVLDSLDENEESLNLIEIEAAVPTEKDLAPLVVGVKNLAGRSGLSVAEMNFTPGEVSTKSATLSAKTKKEKAAQYRANKNKDNQEKKDALYFTVVLRGKQSALGKFLSSIEKTKRLIGVQSIKITLPEKGPYEFELELIAPFKSAKSTGDVIAKPLPTYTSLHEKVFNLLKGFINYTSVSLPLVKTGVKDPFK